VTETNSPRTENGTPEKSRIPVGLPSLIVAAGPMILLHFQESFRTLLLRWPWNLVGLIPMTVGIALYLAGRRALENGGTTTERFAKPSVLVTGGIFRVMQHPMDLGLVLVLIGIAMLCGSWPACVVVVPFAVWLHVVFVGKEAKTLEATFGRRWLAYARRLPDDESVEGDAATPGRPGRLRRLARWLAGRRGGIWLIALTFALPIAAALLLVLDGPGDSWRLSGYYRVWTGWALTGMLAAAWLVATIALAVRRELLRGLTRLIVGPTVLAAGAMVALWVAFSWSPTLGLPNAIVHSTGRDMHFVVLQDWNLDYDVHLRFFSVDGTLWNPVWSREFGKVDSSGEAFQTDPLWLVLSRDEKLLVVQRGKHYSDAIMLDSGKHYTQYISPHDTRPAIEHEKDWQMRTDIINDLLARHGGARD